MQQSKVFGVGLSKTGTTTLNEALCILGYSAIHYPVGLKGVDEHDAATDNPVADKFEMLDAKYPGSKFIYTTREKEDWLRSCRTHWARFVDPDEEATALRRRIYGTPDFDEELFVEAYDRHEKRVLDYFADRPNDLIVLNICAGHEGWGPLCSFLGRQIPDTPFPHLNTTKDSFEYHIDNVGWLPFGAKKQIRRVRRKTKKFLARLQATS